ncbi:MAG: aspartate carbamoyltransferase catalytic subunit [Fimbriimonadaceae bacterium]|nr:aspartate carbamoyltransferase catalytic subunit [Fimbriimonadaceae bacterium]
MSRNLLSIRHLKADDIRDLIKTAQDFKKQVTAGKPMQDVPRRTVGLLFFEASTRTRVSFEQAAHYLGYNISVFAAQSSSLSKGETLKDTVLTLKGERIEALVIRHRSSGSPQLAARFFGGPIVNAGDGEHEHPTQALGDALTILEQRKTIKGLKIAIVGDVLHSRVARSNAWLLSKLGAEVRFVGPKILMPASNALLPGMIYNDLLPGIQDCDVVMCLRLQKERMADGLLSSIGQYRRSYQINRETLKIAAPDCLVMHPGPINRGVELDDWAADGPFSVIQRQIENGIFVRMAALTWVFEPKTIPKSTKTKKGVTV